MGTENEIDNDASKQAKALMQVIEEQSVVIHFLEKVCDLTCLDKIAEEILLSITELGLESVVQLRLGTKDKTLSASTLQEVEEKLLTHLSLTDDRFIELVASS